MAVAGVGELAQMIVIQKQKPLSENIAALAQAWAWAPPPSVPAAEMPAQSEASGSRHQAPALRQPGPKVPAITVTPKLRVVESSSGSDDEFQQEAAEESDSGEDEIEENDATADRRMKCKWDNMNRAQAPW